MFVAVGAGVNVGEGVAVGVAVFVGVDVAVSVGVAEGVSTTGVGDGSRLWFSGKTSVGVAVSIGSGSSGTGVGVAVGTCQVSTEWHLEHCPRGWLDGLSWLWQAVQFV